jgi:hypothetical protein
VFEPTYLLYLGLLPVFITVEATSHRRLVQCGEEHLFPGHLPMVRETMMLQVRANKRRPCQKSRRLRQLNATDIYRWSCAQCRTVFVQHRVRLHSERWWRSKHLCRWIEDTRYACTMVKRVEDTYNVIPVIANSAHHVIKQIKCYSATLAFDSRFATRKVSHSSNNGHCDCISIRPPLTACCLRPTFPKKHGEDGEEKRKTWQ